ILDRTFRTDPHRSRPVGIDLDIVDSPGFSCERRPMDIVPFDCCLRRQRPVSSGGFPILSVGQTLRAPHVQNLLAQLAATAKTAAWRLASSAKVVGVTPDNLCVASSTRDCG